MFSDKLDKTVGCQHELMNQGPEFGLLGTVEAGVPVVHHSVNFLFSPIHSGEIWL